MNQAKGSEFVFFPKIPIDVVVDTVAQVKASHPVYDTPVTVKPGKHG